MALSGHHRERLKLIVLVISFIVLGFSAAGAERYDWEDYDYYQILGLAPSTKMDKATIKKAYRKEAKAWHPDKVVHNESVTVEESNQRFQKIAEAYQVLSDPEQRRNYDTYLQQEQRQRRPENDDFNSRSSENTFGFDDFQMNWQDFDPRKIFEDIFGSTPDFDPRQIFHDLFEQGSAAFESTFGGYEHDNDQSSRNSRSSFGREGDLGKLVFAEEEEKILFDSFSGQEILRVIRVEEYLQQRGSVYYKRVLARDFVEEWDPRSRTFVLVPLYAEPVLLQEDYRPARKADHTYNDQRRQERYQSQQNPRSNSNPHSSRNSKNGQWSSAVGSVLSTGQTLNMQQVLLVEDQDDQLAAGISDECELEIVRFMEDEWGEEAFETIWSSESKSPYVSRGRNECALQLQSNGQLLLLALHGARGQPLVLWSSPEDNSDDPNDDINDFDFRRQRSQKEYIARLDTDGTLSVYILKKVPRGILLALLMDGQFFAENPRLQAIEPHWKKAMSLLLNLQKHPMEEYIRLRCIYSTGPAGCFRPARFVLKQTRPVLQFWQTNGHVLIDHAQKVVRSIRKSLRHPSVKKHMQQVHRFLRLTFQRIDSFLDDLIG